MCLRFEVENDQIRTNGFIWILLAMLSTLFCIGLRQALLLRCQRSCEHRRFSWPCWEHVWGSESWVYDFGEHKCNMAPLQTAWIFEVHCRKNMLEFLNSRELHPLICCLQTVAITYRHPKIIEKLFRLHFMWLQACEGVLRGWQEHGSWSGWIKCTRHIAS